MKFKRGLPALGMAIGLVVTGCGGSSVESTNSDVSAGSTDSNGSGAAAGSTSGLFEVSTGDITLEVAIPAPEEDATIEKIRSYAKLVGFKEPLRFAIQTVVNSGNESVTPCQLRIVTADGQTITFDPAFFVVGDMQDLVSIDETGVYNQGVDLYNSLLGMNAEVLPGATTRAVLVTTAEFGSIQNVFSGTFSTSEFNQRCDVRLTAQ